MPTCDKTLGSNAVGDGLEEKRVVREEDREGVIGVSLLSSAFRLVSITSRALPAILYALKIDHITDKCIWFYESVHKYEYIQHTPIHKMHV